MEQVLDSVSKEYSVIRAKFRALPNALTKHLAIETDPKKVFDQLSSAIEEVFEELQADK